MKGGETIDEVLRELGTDTGDNVPGALVKSGVKDIVIARLLLYTMPLRALRAQCWNRTHSGGQIIAVHKSEVARSKSGAIK